MGTRATWEITLKYNLWLKSKMFKPLSIRTEQNQERNLSIKLSKDWTYDFCKRSGSQIFGGVQKRHMVDAVGDALKSYYFPQRFSFFIFAKNLLKLYLLDTVLDFTKLAIAFFIALQPKGGTVYFGSRFKREPIPSFLGRCEVAGHIASFSQ